MNGRVRYLDWETERRAIDQGMTGQSQVFEYDFTSAFDYRHARRAEHLREIDRS